jgi:membrane-associated phospholipid phosphatase
LVGLHVAFITEMTRGSATQRKRAADTQATAAVARQPGWEAWLLCLARDWTVSVIVAISGLLCVAKVMENVFEHESLTLDGKIQSWVLAHRVSVLDTFFHWVATVGDVTPMCGLAAAGAASLWYRGHRRAAVDVLLAPAIAVTLFAVAKQVYARPRPLGLGGIVPSSYSFPSGHSTASAAICCTLAYIYWREGLVGQRAALVFAILVPLLVGLSRVYTNVHWSTDVLGGWSAGLLIAIVSASLYERNGQRQATSGQATDPATGSIT